MKIDEIVSFSIPYPNITDLVFLLNFYCFAPIIHSELANKINDPEKGRFNQMQDEQKRVKKWISYCEFRALKCHFQLFHIIDGYERSRFILLVVSVPDCRCNEL